MGAFYQPRVRMSRPPPIKRHTRTHAARGTLRSMEHVGEIISQQRIESAAVVGHVFEDCVFDRVSFAGASLDRARFLSCQFKTCDFSNVSVARARLRDCAFVECKLVGVQWVNVEELVCPKFIECNLSYGNFVGLRERKSSFARCTLRDVDFSDADLSECDFAGADLGGARFHNTTLLKANFRDAANYVIDPLRNKLKGAKFSWPEARGLLVGLGVVVEN